MNLNMKILKITPPLIKFHCSQALWSTQWITKRINSMRCWKMKLAELISKETWDISVQNVTCDISVSFKIFYKGFNHFKLSFSNLEFKYLKTHLKECGNVHECQMCQQKFKQKRTFTAHMKKKHGITTLPDKPNTNPPKPFQFLLQSS